MVAFDVANEIGTGIGRGNVNNIDYRIERMAIALRFRKQAVRSSFQVDCHQDAIVVAHSPPVARRLETISWCGAFSNLSGQIQIWPPPISKPASTRDMQHVELVDQVAEDDRAVAGHRASLCF